jgi:hypothetical protein
MRTARKDEARLKSLRRKAAPFLQERLLRRTIEIAYPFIHLMLIASAQSRRSELKPGDHRHADLAQGPPYY